MYAQVVQGGASLQNREAMDRLVIDRLIPALREEPGFAGALNLVDRSTGHAMMISLWDTEAQARRPLPEYGPSFQDALSAIMAVSSGERAPISVWEVNARF
jgi:hypothetical protein